MFGLFTIYNLLNLCSMLMCNIFKEKNGGNIFTNVSSIYYNSNLKANLYEKFLFYKKI